jgi:hypothetical protein
MAFTLKKIHWDQLIGTLLQSEQGLTCSEGA